MDENVIRRLTRQLRLLNIFLGVFGVLGLAALAVVAVLLYKVITFADHTSKQLTSIEQKTQQNLDAKSQLCASNVRSFLPSNFCNPGKE